MKKHVVMAVFWLPLMVMLTLAGWVFLGALPRMHDYLTGDLVAWLAELPVVTCYALAAGVATMFTMHATGMNLDNEIRSRLLTRAAEGDLHARGALNDEAKQWFAFTALWALYFFPHW